MQITNLQTGDTFNVIETIFGNNMVHIRTTIDGKEFVITISEEEYNTSWQ